jgi:cytochrome P450
VLAKGKVVGSIIDMQDEDKNTALKRGVGGAFAVKNLLDYERDLDRTVDELTQRILENPTFDLFEVLRFFQLDFLTKIAFSENLGHLRTGQDVWGITGSSRDRIAHWARWQPLPNLERLIYQHPLWSGFTNQSSRWAQVALEKLHARESRGGIPTKKDLLQKYIDASEKHPDTIKHDAISAMVTSTISAGFDSTSVTMTSIIYYLITHPDVHGKLMLELEQGIEDGHLSSKPQYSEVNKLPYLDAVFKEAMRCNPFLTVPLERVVPPEGAKISGTWIPGGTAVGCLATVIHQNRDCFGQDADKFRPERWLTDDPKATIAMERASLGFGSGKRVCLGRHIAELEIKKMIPALLLKFKVRGTWRKVIVADALT